MAIVGNSSATAIATINEQFDRLTCPMPAISGLWNNTGTIMYSGGTYNYANVSSPVLTLTCTEVHTIDGYDYFYGAPTIPFAGFPFFLGDWISEIFANKLSAFFTILTYILTPANFSAFGYTIADISGQALMLIIGVYAMCYIAIGALIYKIISPFAGAG